MQATKSSSASPTVVIRPRKGWQAVDLREVWEYRELLYFLVWRDVKVRYKQTAFGATWVIVQPLMTMVIFSVIFGKLAKLPSDGIPYPVFSFVAILPWNLFSGALLRSTQSMTSSAGLLTKVFFPRLIIPLSGILVPLVDFGVAFVVMLGLMAYYQIVPTWAVLTLPLFTGLALITALSVGLCLSSINARYRDVGIAMPYLVQAWMYASPVAYSTKLIPERWELIYALNPMVGVIEGFRWALLDTGEGPGPMLLVSSTVTLVALVFGVFFFRRMEKTVADIV